MSTRLPIIASKRVKLTVWATVCIAGNRHSSEHAVNHFDQATSKDLPYSIDLQRILWRGDGICLDGKKSSCAGKALDSDKQISALAVCGSSGSCYRYTGDQIDVGVEPA